MKSLKLDDTTILEEFNSITLSEMDEVKLMNRTDTKFVFKRADLGEFLNVLKKEYRVLNVDNNLVSSYKTLYYDTPDFDFFMDHHNGRGNRFKVRIRNYIESDLYFLEIKNKYKERTIKNRIEVENFQVSLSEKSNAYVQRIIGHETVLEAKLWNSFERISLVNIKSKERLTFDLGITFCWDNVNHSLEHVVIAELKQEKANRESVFYALMKKNGIRPSGLSKYCIGAVALNPNLKYNNFKEKLILIDKLF